MDEHMNAIKALLWYNDTVQKVKEFEINADLHRDLELDVEYIEEMHRKEDDPHRSAFPHIVSVSGLALNVLLRLENEHATALKRWSSRL